MLIRDSRRPGEQIAPDHDGRHAVYIPRPAGQHPTAATAPRYLLPLRTHSATGKQTSSCGLPTLFCLVALWAEIGEQYISAIYEWSHRHAASGLSMAG